MNLGMINILFRPGAVLAGFMAIKSISAVFNGLTMGTTEAWGIGVLALLTYGVIAWFAYKGQLISIWAVSIIMLYEGAGTLLLSLANFDAAPGIAMLGLAVSAYLILGGLVVFASRRKRG